MARVRKTRKGVTVELGAEERRLLRGLPDELAPVLTAEPAGDPVRDRLFPHAYLDPTEEQAEVDWQGMVHSELVDQKLAALTTLAATLDSAGEGESVKLSLQIDEAEAWLAALNDARLALGVALEITEDREPAMMDPADPDVQPYVVYDWLTWLQGSLVDALTER